MIDQSPQNSLDRYLSQTDVWALSLGCIIGWGAFVMPGTTFLPVAGPLGTVVSMAIGTLITLIIGFNYFYLMKQFPGTGGVYSYSKETLGRDHAFLSSWFLCLSYLSLIPQNATILAAICRTLWGDRIRGMILYQVAGSEVYLGEVSITIAALVAIGLLAIYMKSLLQKIQTVLAVVFLLGIVIIAFVIAPQLPVQEMLYAFGKGHESPVRAVMSIVILAPWAFVGFEVVSLETAHFRFPVKKAGKLIALAILMGGCVYSVMVLCAITAQPEGYSDWLRYIEDLSSFNGMTSVPTFYAMEQILGSLGTCIIGITAGAAVITSIIGFYRASARILMNMAEDHILSDSFNNPPVCFLFLMSVSIIISLFGTTAIAWVVDLSSFGAIVGFGYASVAVCLVAEREKRSREKAVGFIGFFLAVGFAVTQLIPGISMVETMGAESYLLLSIWCLIGFAFYWRTMSSDTGQNQENESTTIAALFFLMILSVVIWYVKKAAALNTDSASSANLVQYSVILILFILLGLIVMLLIHSKLKKRQVLLETERIRALESSQAKSRFLFNMSHDIRTPMNAIIGYTHLALKEQVSPVAQDYLEKIELSSKHMLSLINDILEMSRIESGKMELEPVPCDLCKLFVEMKHLFSEQMLRKNLHFSVETGHVKHHYVWCDQKNLNRVLLNLLSNAYKFTPEGGTVSAQLEELESVEKGFGCYEMRIQDSGIGMSLEFADKMFTAFERERTSTDSGVEGTGLGLAITKSIVDLMGGTIGVATAPGTGTEIIVKIQFRLAEEKDFPETAQKEVPEREEGIDYSKKRLLLVEDNMINLEIAKMILSQQGFMLETAENGQIAVDMVSASEPGYYHAVLMDIQMPVMDGYTAARAIRSLDNKALSKIPILAMTANAFKEDEEAAFAAGMNAHIAKPIDVDQLMNALRKVL